MHCRHPLVFVFAGLLGAALATGNVAAAGKTFRLSSPFPFAVQVRVLGDGPQFPQVLLVPAPPAAPVPVPYPDLTMRLQLKLPNGQWSPTMKLPWRSGPIALPKP